MTGYRCPLGALQPNKPNAEQTKRDGWRDHGILVVSIDDERLTGWDREWIENIGRRLYGERGA